MYFIDHISMAVWCKAKRNYRGSAENPATQKFSFFIDNSNINFILYTLIYPKFKSKKLKQNKLIFPLEKSIKK